MNKRVEKIFNNLYKSVFNKLFNSKDIKKAYKKGNKQYFYNKANLLKKSKKFDKLAYKYSNTISKTLLNTSKENLKKEYINAKKNKQSSLPSTYKEYELNLLKEVILENFKLIKTIPDKVMETYKYKYIDNLIHQVATGKKPRGSFEKVLRESNSKNAKVIARTETAKLQTYLQEKKSTSLGSICYEWVSSNDPRTRPSHKDMNGVIVFWRSNINEKPLLDELRGNAGEFPNCRCFTKPIYDENDLNKTKYKVYNYKTNEIVNKTKNELIELINNGGF